MKHYSLLWAALTAAALAALPARGATVANVKKLAKAPAIAVSYTSSYNGKAQPGATLMTVCGTQVATTRLEADGTPAAQKEGGPQTGYYMDYAAGQWLRRAVLPGGRVVSAARGFEYGKGLTPDGEAVILGLPCQKVKTFINSNTIEIWYTRQLPQRGTPQAGVGVPDGLVLKISRNGNMVQEATAITPLKTARQLLPADWGDRMDDADYTYTLNQCEVITVPVFDQERVAFDASRLPEGRLESGRVYRAGGGTIILKKVSLPQYVADRDVFAEVVQYSAGDAYDRTGSVFVITQDRQQSFLDAIRSLKSVPAFHSGQEDYHALVSTPEYTVPTELMRFFTGFGVRQFNHNRVPGQHWVDSVVYKTEVTSLCEKLQGEVWIGAYIGNWDKNGHRFSLRLKYYPDDEHRVMTAMPLFNTVNYLEQDGQPYPTFLLGDSLRVSFTLPHDVKGARLYYLTTGHGGWGGGDEFNQKPNTLLLDGQKIITFIPWRDDCGTYRNNSPCSGNFSNGLSSSDLSRSNWCPGTVTNPEYIHMGDIPAGKHTLTVAIPQGAPEGGSNSYWCVSGTLIY